MLFSDVKWATADSQILLIFVGDYVTCNYKEWKMLVWDCTMKMHMLTNVIVLFWCKVKKKFRIIDTSSTDKFFFTTHKKIVGQQSEQECEW